MNHALHPHVRGLGLASKGSRKRLIEQIRKLDVASEAVLAAMQAVPRHLFVDEAIAGRAYDNTALPIGYGQTISQPAIVARMTQLIIGLDEPPKKVLEIGTGSGYQAAILSKLVAQVYTVERIRPLYQQAQKRLRKLGYRNVHARLASSTQLGLESQGPYDAILLACAAEDLPKALYSQMADGGRMITPVGAGRAQKLMLIERQGDTFSRQILDDVSFVPLVYSPFDN